MGDKSGVVAAITASVYQKCVLAGKAAIQTAIKEIQKDFKKKVIDKTIEEYYNDYSPKRYKRIKGIEPAFDVFGTVKGNGLSGEIRLEYDYRKMPKHYSNSKYHQKEGRSSNSEFSGGWISRFQNPTYYPNQKNFGTPENGWIFQNFMEGIHPDGSTDGDGYQYEASYIRLKRHIEEYANDNKVSDILEKHFKKHIKRYL